MSHDKGAPRRPDRQVLDIIGCLEHKGRVRRGEPVLDIRHFDIDGPILFTPIRNGDSRGFFSEVFRSDVFEQHCGAVHFVQDNHSRSGRRGTLRGLHFQSPPMRQGKLVRVTRGAAFDVAVDARPQSPTYGRHVAVTLSEENWSQLWVPPGFLHGFCTLCDDVEFLYKVTAYYSPEYDGAVAWNDPDLGIAWPFDEGELFLSGRDQSAPRLKDLTVVV